MSEQSMVLKEVKSGKIEMVDTNGLMTLQFNCSCEDALPFCKGMCCRMREIYSAVLAPGEQFEYDSQQHPRKSELFILQSKKTESGAEICKYLDNETSRCGVHDSGKPKGCRNWHCSPGGKGEGIELRDSGWMVLPVNGNLGERGTV